MSLRYEHTASHVYEKLKNIPRTGWVMRGVPNPETVYDHTVSLVKLVDELCDDLSLSSDEADDLKHILEIHDWSEAVAGDEFIPNENAELYKIKKVEKAKREREGLAALLEGKPYEHTVTELFMRYEAGADKIAKLAKELDKFQALRLAGEYERTYNIPLFDEFYQYYLRDKSFSNPVLLQKIESIRTTLSSD